MLNYFLIDQCIVAYPGTAGSDLLENPDTYPADKMNPDPDLP